MSDQLLLIVLIALLVVIVLLPWRIAMGQGSAAAGAQVAAGSAAGSATRAARIADLDVTKLMERMDWQDTQLRDMLALDKETNKMVDGAKSELIRKQLTDAGIVPEEPEHAE